MPHAAISLRSIAIVVGASAAVSALALTSASAAVGAPAGYHWELISSTDLPEAGGYIAVNETTNRYYVSASAGFPDNSTIYAFDGATNAPLGSFVTPPVPQYMDIDEVRNELYVPIWGQSEQILKVDLDDFTDIESLSITDWVPYSVNYDPVNDRLYVLDGDDVGLPTEIPSIRVIDPTTTPMSVLSTILIDPSGAGPALDTTTGRLFVPIEGDSYTAVVDTATSAVIAGIYPFTTSGIQDPLAAAADPGLGRIYVANATSDNSANSVSVLDSAFTLPLTPTNTGVIVPSIPIGAANLDAVTGIAVDDVRHLVAVSAVSGTTATDPVGRVYIIDGTTNAITDVISMQSDDDAAANVQFNTATGTLYVASNPTDPATGDVIGRISAFRLVADVVPAGPTLPATGSELALPLGLAAAALLFAGASLVLTRRRVRS